MSTLIRRCWLPSVIGGAQALLSVQEGYSLLVVAVSGFVAFGAAALLLAWFRFAKRRTRGRDRSAAEFDKFTTPCDRPSIDRY